MATGLGGISPQDLPRYLEGIDFPANRMDILQAARQHHADPKMIEELEKLANEEYESLDEVVEEYGKLH